MHGQVYRKVPNEPVDATFNPKKGKSKQNSSVAELLAFLNTQSVQRTLKHVREHPSGLRDNLASLT